GAACDGEKSSRRLVAEAEAGASQPGRAILVAGGPFEVRDQLVRAPATAGDVIADVQDPPRSRFQRKQRVEGGHAVGIGGRDAKALADVAERALADEAHPGLHRLEGREKQVTPAPAEAGGEMGAVAPRIVTEPRIDRLAFLGSRLR